MALWTNLTQLFRPAQVRALRRSCPPRLDALEDRICPHPYLLVTDGGSVGGVSQNAIYRYDGITGAFVDVPVFHQADMVGPDLGVTLDPSGANLLVDGFGSNNVVRFDLATFNPNPAPGQSGATFVAAMAGGLRGTEGLSFGADGNLYVANDLGANSTILQCDPDTGAVLSTFISSGIDQSNDIKWEQDPVTGNWNLFVSDFTMPGRFLRFDQNGNPNPSPGHSGADFVDPISGDSPNGWSVDQNGNFLVSYVDDSTALAFVNRYAPDGSPLPAPGQSGATFIPQGTPGLFFIDGMTVGPDGNVYVTSEAAAAGQDQTVQEFDGTTGLPINQTFVAPHSGGIQTPAGLLFYDDGTGPGRTPPPPGHHGPHSTDATLESASPLLGQFQQTPLPGGTFSGSQSNGTGWTPAPRPGVLDTGVDHSGTHWISTDPAAHHVVSTAQQDANVPDALFSTL
jgi:sugar lactone lactonase YvrE